MNNEKLSYAMNAKKKYLPYNIKFAMEQAKIKKDELCEYLGMSIQEFDDLNSLTINSDILHKLSEILNVDEKFLLHGNAECLNEKAAKLYNAQCKLGPGPTSRGKVSTF